MRRMFYLTAGTIGSLCGALLGCDASVQQTMMNGLQSGSITVAGAVLTALFQMWSNDNSTATTTGGAMLDTAFRLVAMVL
jgi:hypothetical protein